MPSSRLPRLAQIGVAAALGVASLGVSTAAFADGHRPAPTHAAERHAVEGKVSAISATSITIGNDGRSLTLAIGASTTFSGNTSAAVTAASILVGSNVRVTVDPASVAAGTPTAANIELLTGD